MTSLAPRKRVLLVNLNKYDQPHPIYPLGLAYINGALLDAGYETRLWDHFACAESGATVADFVRDFRPDYVGLSLRNIDNVQSHNPHSFVESLLQTCRDIRALTGVPIILGGSGYSVFPREILKFAPADYGIMGEGELVLVELLRALDAGGSPRDIPGLVWREADGTVGALARDARKVCFSSHPVHEPEVMQAYLTRGSLPGVQTQRGCPLNCCYCTYPLIEGRHSRVRSGEEIAEEMARLSALGVREAFVVDSVFNTSPEHAAAVCESLIRADNKVTWGCFLKPRFLSRELLALMKRAGMSHLEFGSDSFSDPVLTAYKKGFRYEHILQSSLLAHELGIKYAHFLIFGGPGETPATVEETLARAATLPGAIYFTTIGMRIYPGTPLWKQSGPDATGETTEDFLFEPRFHIEKPLTVSGLYERLNAVRLKSSNWVVGDPPAEFSETMDKLRRRGRTGPMWEYIEVLQRRALEHNPDSLTLKR